MKVVPHTVTHRVEPRMADDLETKLGAGRAIPVKIKWGKEKLELEVDPAEPVEVLRMQLYSLTGVPAERQKIMCKKHWKGTLKDTDE